MADKKVKTKAKKVKDLKRGNKVQLPPQVLLLVEKTKFDVPTIKGDVFKLVFQGMKGPLAGEQITILGHVDESFDFVLKAPWLQRVIMSVVNRFFWNPELAPSPKKA